MPHPIVPVQFYTWMAVGQFSETKWTNMNTNKRKNKEKKKILFITERRADYSRLKPIMKEVQKSDRLELQLIVTGMHLLRDYGRTERIIKDDGFRIDAILPIFRNNDTDDGASMVRAMGRALQGLPAIFERLQPDIVFAGFDIGANFAAAIAGMHMNIPACHIQGGEVSGTVDEVIRHALTKFSHIHFPATKESARRIVKLGEDPKYVFVVGSPSLDTIKKIKYLSKKKIFSKFNLNPEKKLIILLQHSITTEVNNVTAQIANTISAIRRITNAHNVQALAVYSNNDAGGKRIVKKLQQSGIATYPHIVYEDFLNLMKQADVLVGNSSAAIHEAPSFGLPAVNIGTRQQFRERGKNVIDSAYDKNSIVRNIERALFDKKLIRKIKRSKNPYDSGNTAERVVKILERIELPPIQKRICY